MLDPSKYPVSVNEVSPRLALIIRTAPDSNPMYAKIVGWAFPPPLRGHTIAFVFTALSACNPAIYRKRSRDCEIVNDYALRPVLLILYR